jgi:hypothetical protein
MGNLLATFAPVFLSGLMMIRVAAHAGAEPGDYFKITILDEETGRGVPLVELKTTNEVRYYTDSNGIVAFYEPGLMDQSVYFEIKSHGYEFPADFLGFRGKALRVTRGGSTVLKIKRVNVAERLYRITGEGIYRDSVLVGHPVPLKNPLLNAQVMGQDTVLVTPYRGKLYWFWGDTNQVSYQLGHFATSGATSELPGKGGLDPSVGVDLTYFVSESGFSKPMCDISGPGLKWMFWVTTITDQEGRERLIGRYRSMKDLGEPLEGGLVIFNDKTEALERLVRSMTDIDPQISIHPFRAVVDGEEYLYLPSPYPDLRVKGNLKEISDPRSYEAFTYLVAGSRYDRAAPKLDRGPDGQLVYAWKANSQPVDFDRQRELIAAGKMRPDEALVQLRDVETDTLVTFRCKNDIFCRRRITGRRHGDICLRPVFFIPL